VSENDDFQSPSEKVYRSQTQSNTVTVTINH